MSIDFKELLEKAPRADGHAFNDSALPEGTETLVADAITLRKQWAKKPSFWIEVLYAPPIGAFSITKRWRWFNRRTNKWVEGDSRSSGIKSLSILCDRYSEAVREKLSHDYVAVERVSQSWSPIHDIEIESISSSESEDLKPVEKSSPFPYRKPKWDI